MPVVPILEALLGLAIVVAIIWDVYQTVVLPRPTPTRRRLARVVTRTAYRFWRWRAGRARNADRRERWLGTFAPTTVLLLLFTWVGALVVGYGLVVHALATEFSPPPTDLGTAVYAAGTALFTIGYGDIVPNAPLARILVLFAAGTGLGTVALGITYLFSLYGSFQRREVLVTTLDERAGAPPSGVDLLVTYARTGMVADLPALFGSWEAWAAEVLDSHLSYPILVYFRSTHDNESWVSSLGAVLDAAVLCLTTLEDVPRGKAEMLVGIGAHFVEDLGGLFGFSADSLPGVEEDEYATARRKLAAAGYAVRPEEIGWAAFAALRTRYAARLNRLAGYLLTPPAQWVGDRESSGMHSG